MEVMIEEGAYAPARAHATDAGLDLRTPEDVRIWPGGSAVIDTRVHIRLPEGTVGLVKNLSGLNVRRGLVTCGDGVIDEGYTGSIRVKLYNLSSEVVWLEPGDRIAQLVVIPVRYETVQLVGRLPETERGDAGFGSTGR